jgi:hypothetical protein
MKCRPLTLEMKRLLQDAPVRRLLQQPVILPNN